MKEAQIDGRDTNVDTEDFESEYKEDSIINDNKRIKREIESLQKREIITSNIVNEVFPNVLLKYPWEL